MDPNRLTEKSQLALQEAQKIAVRFGHQEVDGEHLLLALVQQEDGIVPKLLSKAQADSGPLVEEIERDLGRRPRVSGSGYAPDRILLSQRLARLLVKAEDRWLPVPLRAVRRLSADGKHVRVHAEGAVHVLRTSLAELERRLDPRRFVRVHRGEIVALDAVAHLEPWDHGDGLLVLKDGSKVVLSRTYRTAFLERWGLEG